MLQGLFTIRRERQIMEQLNYNLLFRRFVGLKLDDAVWVLTVFSKKRDRLIAGKIADAFLPEVLKAADVRALVARALHRGRHAARGVGEPRALPAQREFFAPAVRRGSQESYRRLSRGKAFQHHA